MGIASEIVELVRLIAEMARAGLSDAEIDERLKDPTSVGADLIKKIQEREDAGEAYLGRKRR